MKKVICYVGMLCSSVVHAQLQTDTTTHLNELVVRASRFDLFNAGVKTTQPDSLALHVAQANHLGDLLSQQTPVFIKTYGPSNIATAAFRGTNAEHTAILWNGFNLQSSMMGLADLSLIPVSFNDKVTVEHGGNGALFGSGAIGGAIRLQSMAAYGSGLHLGASFMAGSFGQFRQGYQLRYGAKKWFTSLKVFQQLAENNFTYTNTSLSNQPEQTQSHASTQMKGLVNEHFFTTGKHHEFTLRIWYQQADRFIPPVMSVSNGSAKQFDESVRLAADWKASYHKLTSNTRIAWFDEVLNFHDAPAAIHSYSKLKTMIGEWELFYQLNDKHRLLFGVSNTWSQGFHESYQGWQQLNRLAFFTAWKYQSTNQRLLASMSLRQEFPDRSAAPLIPSWGAEYRLNNHIKLLGNIAASYRFPTLNERYFAPGGNPDLKPETGWGQELSIQIKHSLLGVFGVATITGYNRTTDNWIIWVPQGSFAAPRNLRSVWSRGAETQIKLDKSYGKTTLSWSSSANLTFTTNRSSVLNNDESVGKQLLYIPRLAHQHWLRLLYRNYNMQYTHQYNGMRYTSTDNSDWLNAYQVANLAVGGSWKMASTTWTLGFSTLNLFNNSYVVLPERPMPGRNYQLTLNINI